MRTLDYSVRGFWVPIGHGMHRCIPYDLVPAARRRLSSSGTRQHPQFGKRVGPDRPNQSLDAHVGAK